MRGAGPMPAGESVEPDLGVHVDDPCRIGHGVDLGVRAAHRARAEDAVFDHRVELGVAPGEVDLVVGRNAGPEKDWRWRQDA